MPGRPIEIVVVEDDEDLREEVVGFLAGRGFVARAAGSGAALDRTLDERPADIIVLDLGLPDEDGTVVATRLRRREPPVGLIMMTARAQAYERVLGYDIGADVYMVKPVDYDELEAAIRSLVRRLGPERAVPERSGPERAGSEPFAPERPAPGPAAEPSAHGEPAIWVLDLSGWTLTAPDGEAIRLTGAEMDLMALLTETPGQPVGRAAIARRMGRAGGGGDDDHRYIDAIASRLRRKMAKRFPGDPPIQAAYSKGYLFAAPVQRTG
jgi:DNA-binding response OmpR family regulator